MYNEVELLIKLHQMFHFYIKKIHLKWNSISGLKLDKKKSRIWTGAKNISQNLREKEFTG